MPIELSVLDQSPLLEGHNEQEALAQTIQLAKHVDDLGYKRFWMSEHHSTKSLAGSAPEILVSAVAAHTNQIRVGTGGVLLPHYTPYKVAETFRVLEGLYPERIDLGVGRAPGGMPGVNYALNRGQYPDVQSYPTQVSHLIDYLTGNSPEGYHVKASPLSETTPPVFMLGSSGGSASVAGQLGTGYTFAQFINGDGHPAAIERYYNSFIPSPLMEEPHASVAVFAVVGDTEEEAEFLASSLDYSLLTLAQGKPRHYFPSPEEASQYKYNMYEEEAVRDNRKRMIVGDVESVKQQIEHIAETFNVQEVMVNCIVSPFERRLDSYTKLAKAFNM
ncbi:LLM class flavin-dependent oxidoreductase [Aquisalibacillus elongatus]|uniref:Luciferase family oxidoreductase group 1 n=1 Tax=Aquisalibacillus elongatus TaxID=485577 RepID=A0A3N5BKC5_9BACI|nr:LLM class flavin-dependent oxidoreductase [Aquisalibacillus elongatus]RPF57079.1 luciferase family oxidoreductase group 1 [Aquisalibacillus elongatus]